MIRAGVAAAATAAVLLLLLLQLAPGCGGPACGDGNLDPGEACDDGNTRDDDGCTNACKAAYSAQLNWTIVGQEVPPFKDNCSGVTASKIKLELSGPITMTQELECSFFQYIFNGLSPGSYTVRGTLMQTSGTPVTMGNAVSGFTIVNGNVQAGLDFPFEDFINSYNGNWFYRFRWGGADTCAGAVPPVAMTRIRLERGGNVIMDTAGTPIDGATPGPCYDASEGIAHAVNNLPWGTATVTVTGLDGAGMPQFRESFETFIGAGVANEPWVYDVQSLNPDAGVPDAGVPDAGAVDASTGP